MYIRNNNQKGLTIIELIIALGVFSLAVLAAVSIFVTSLRTQRSVLANQTGLDNLRYVMETMSKEARMASMDTGSCGHSGFIYHVSESGIELSFVNYKNNCVIYTLTDNQLIKEVISNGESSGQLPVTSEDVLIESVQFKASESDVSVRGVKQPKLTINIAFRSKVSAEASDLNNLQTTISSRFY